ncbi:MucR family transcriptional regulator, partial [Sinorhizobium medicae]|nr:MucR family transcriptional regulator [Sinorhizobium medicae]MDX1054437.1 MucR family transcriptional regulator [Sinorhizobium medicae]
PNYARKRSELARATGLGKKSAAKLSQAVRSA